MYRIETVRRGEHFVWEVALEPSGAPDHCLGSFKGDKLILQNLVRLHNGQETLDIARRGKTTPQASLPLQSEEEANHEN